MASTTYVVTAPLVVVKNEAGADMYLYQGATVPEGVSAEDIKRLKADDMIATEKQAAAEAAEEQKEAGAAG